jgi:YidC/Oxa1 family membrane protein insertase
MDFLIGIWDGVVAFLNWLLQGIYAFTGNYGIAIILLTILVKLVLLPLTIKQTRSIIAMQKIQPEIKKLQEKYKDDKEKLSQEMMKFYKENKVNPLGGCLPLLLQLPIFFALFSVLRTYLLTPPTVIVGNTYAIIGKIPEYAGSLGAYASMPILKDTSFLGINLADSMRLANIGATIVFLALLGLSTWYSQKQVMSDPRQKNMMLIMPLITVFIGWSLPAGVVLYWLTTNILQIVQQWAMEYYDKKHPKEVPKGKKEAPEKAAAAKPKAQQTAKGKKPAQGKTPAKGAAKAAAGKQKPKPAGAGQKSKSSGKKKPAPPKGGKAASQARRPKGPPPSQKKTQKGSGGKGGTRKK